MAWHEKANQFQVAILRYQGVTALDAVGPAEVLSRMNNTEARFVGKEVEPVTTEGGELLLGASHTLAETLSFRFMHFLLAPFSYPHPAEPGTQLRDLSLAGVPDLLLLPVHSSKAPAAELNSRIEFRSYSRGAATRIPSL
jgi:hypothetical protein